MPFLKRFQLSAGAAAFSLALFAQPYERPTMGWSSWNTYRVNINAELITKQADAMVRQGLQEAGYEYVNIDDGFFGGRDAKGELRIHPKRFPEGLQPVVDHIHRLGLKAGIYSDAGRNTCGHYWDRDTLGTGVGFYGHDRQDAEFFFKKHGFDFIKIDFCGGDARQNAEQLHLDERERYTAIRKAIDQTGRKDVRINVCRWNFPGTWVQQIGSSWRIDADITADWNAVKRIIRSNRYLSAYATGGHYNDMDMLEIGRGLTAAEERTHFGMWCIQSSPLLIGCDLTTIAPSSLALLKNRELIALNQDPLALQAYVVKEVNGVYLYVKDVQTLHGTRRAVALYNPTETDQTFTLDMAEVDLAGRVKVRDVMAQRDLETVSSGRCVVEVPRHDTRIFLLQAQERRERTVYEAETAWLERFQCLGFNHRAGYAAYADDACCSGGGKVVWLGNHADNYLEWRNVYSAEGGAYTMTLDCIADEARELSCRINGEKEFTLRVTGGTKTGVQSVSLPIVLRKGLNVIRLSNAGAWGPDLDRMTLKAQHAKQKRPNRGSIHSH